jgi:hypothetical protein
MDTRRVMTVTLSADTASRNHTLPMHLREFRKAQRSICLRNVNLFWRSERFCVANQSVSSIIDKAVAARPKELLAEAEASLAKESFACRGSLSRSTQVSGGFPNSILYFTENAAKNCASA